MDNTNMDMTLEELDCPSIVFKVKKGYYAINSKNVSSILRLPEYEEIPGTDQNILGMFLFRGVSVPIIDMRKMFGVPSLQDEYKAFADMLEHRKQDHINWVNELERAIKNNEDFRLETDPHKCTFGKWYDNYKTDNQVIGFHMRKIDEPHKNLHRAADNYEKCPKDCENCKREECLKNILDRAKLEYMPRVLSLLDEAIELFGSEVYHEMVLVVGTDDNNLIGILVDEVISVEKLEKISDNRQLKQFQDKGYTIGVSKSTHIENMILDLDKDKILNYAGALKID